MWRPCHANGWMWMQTKKNWGDLFPRPIAQDLIGWPKGFLMNGTFYPNKNIQGERHSIQLHGEKKINTQIILSILNLKSQLSALSNQWRIRSPVWSYFRIGGVHYNCSLSKYRGISLVSRIWKSDSQYWPLNATIGLVGNQKNILLYMWWNR